MNARFLRPVLITGLLLGMASQDAPAQATSKPGTTIRSSVFLVSVSVENACQISSAKVANSDPGATPLEGKSSLATQEPATHFNVNCSKNTRYLLYLVGGRLADSNASARRVAGNLQGSGVRAAYLDPGFSRECGGSRSGGTDRTSAVGTGGNQVFRLDCIRRQERSGAEPSDSMVTVALTF